jgi:hypothetical protein
MNNLKHTTITVDDRCLDLLLTEDEIAIAFERSIKTENLSYIPTDKCCKCWPITKPPYCSFWHRILGMCLSCKCPD